MSSIAEENPNVVHTLQLVENTGIVPFMEVSLFTLSKHPILNWVFSIIFFAMFILDSISIMVITDQDAVTDFRPLDIIFLLTSFTMENASDEEMEFALISVIVGLIIAGTILLVILCLSTHYSVFLVEYFNIILFYITPIFFPAIMNVLTRNFDLIEKNGFKSVTTLGMIVEFVFLFIFGIFSCYYTTTNYLVDHPFIGLQPFHSAMLIGYFVFASVLTTFFKTDSMEYQIIRCIIASIIIILVFIIPPYRSRVLNSILLFTAFEKVVGSIVRLSSDIEFTTFLYFMIPEIFVAFILMFFIVPLILKRNGKGNMIVYSFLMNRMDIARQHLEQFHFRKIPTNNMRLVIYAALNIVPSNLRQLVSFYGANYANHHHDIYLYQNALHICTSIEGNVATDVINQIKEEENRCHAIEREFWRKAWVSDINSLPKLASKLGRAKYIMIKNAIHYSQNYPSLISQQFLEEKTVNMILKAKEELSKRKSFKVYTWIEIFPILALIIVIVGHSILYSESNKQWDVMDKFLLFRTMASHFISSEMRIISGDAESPFSGTIYTLYESYNNLKKNEHNSLIIRNSFNTEFIPGTNLEILLNQLFDILLENQTAFDKELLDNITYTMECCLTNVYQIFLDSSLNKVNTKTLIVIAVMAFVLIILIIICIAHFCKVSKEASKYYESFRLISKESIREYYNFDHAIDSMDFYNLKTGFNVATAYPLSFAHTMSLLIGHLFQLVLLIANSKYIESNTMTMRNALAGFAEIELIPLLVAQALIGRHGATMDPAYKMEFHDILIRSSLIFDELLHIKDFDQYTNLIPEEYIKYQGDSLVIDENYHSNADWFNFLFEIFTRFKAKDISYRYMQFYWTRRFVTFVVFSVLVFLVFEIIDWILTTFVISEYKEGFQLLKDIKNPDKEEIDGMFDLEEEDSKDFLLNTYDNKATFNCVDLPVFAFVVDRHIHMIFATKMAVKELGIDVGESLRDSNLSVEVRNELKTKVKHFKKHKSALSESIIYNRKNTSLELNPYYVYHKKGLRLNHVFIFFENESPSALDDISNKFTRLFRSLYPPYIPLDQKFPLSTTIEPKLSFLFVAIKLFGFHEWANTVDIEIACKYRQSISNMIISKLSDYSSFVLIRQTADTIILSTNRSDKSLNIWQVVKNGATFGREVIELIKNMNRDYFANISSLVHLFKTKEPQMYFSEEKTSQTDFNSDLLYINENQGYSCRIESVNYTTPKKEMKMLNTTKYKTCFTSYGEQFDLFFVV